MLERKRAEDIYNQLKQQAIDPGLLQMGERGAEEAKRTSVFSARIVPIPALRNQAAGNRVSRIYSGREPKVLLRDSAPPGCILGTGGAASPHQLRFPFGARPCNFQASAKAFR